MQIQRPSDPFFRHDARCAVASRAALAFLAAAAVFAALSGAARAQQDTIRRVLEPVVVTAGKLPMQVQEATRSVEIIDRRALRETAPATLDDALRGLSSVYVQRRGPYGTQSDLSVRGGSFNQTLMLVDGLPVNDPQTGHFALEIPLPVAFIDRIEVLPGHGSSLLGADAFGGAVNIVPVRAGRSFLGASLEGGSHGMRRGAGEAGWGGEDLPSFTAAEYRASDGWRSGTDFAMLSLGHITRASLGAGRVTLLAGYADRNFGAFDFYSPGRGIPSRERVKTAYAMLSGAHPVGSGAELSAAVTFRDLHDRFQFDARIPDRYINTHHTQAAGGEVRLLAAPAADVTLAVGADAYGDRIASSNLGDHSRGRLAASAAAQWTVAPQLHVDAGMRWDAQSGAAPQLNPSAGVLLHVRGDVSLHASIGRSFRLPTYTDLYYSDPVSRGNPDLRPESAWSGEAGAAWTPAGGLSVTAAVFRREQRDMIDYVQRAPSDPYVAMNYPRATVSGVEGAVRWRGTAPALIDDASASGTAISTRIDTRGAYATRYAFAAPASMLRLRVHGTLPASVEWNVTGTAVNQRVARDYATVDARLSRAFGSVALWIAADNVTNSAMQEFSGLPLPGRWMRAGADFRLPSE